MNLANKLTIARVILVPVFLLFIYVECPAHYLIALTVFAAASITDALDGHIARKNHLITNFGKFLDPLADKVLVMAALAVFIEIDDVKMSAIPFIIITAREFMVSGLRLLAANSGVVVAAGIWGKMKTAFTMVTIIAELAWLSFNHDFDSFGLISGESARDAATVIFNVLIWISTALTVISGGVYLKGYGKLISSDK
ncbi:MAG: CDP-diacylglycerol--glycerol-3-phosphate 3-phosphatidyltransferase [Ruminococcus sp.]|nr:CDP-diacylglycerol--glycerol-3-phosphate 3-phosphatidyltransferase [Ruminococcus sp.]